jgi:hypothetical protein
MLADITGRVNKDTLNQLCKLAEGLDLTQADSTTLEFFKKLSIACQQHKLEVDQSAYWYWNIATSTKSYKLLQTAISYLINGLFDGSLKLTVEKVIQYALESLTDRNSIAASLEFLR